MSLLKTFLSVRLRPVSKELRIFVTSNKFLSSSSSSSRCRFHISPFRPKKKNFWQILSQLYGPSFIQSEQTEMYLIIVDKILHKMLIYMYLYVHLHLTADPILRLLNLQLQRHRCSRIHRSRFQSRGEKIIGLGYSWRCIFLQRWRCKSRL
jgi:hypothetical protein